MHLLASLLSGFSTAVGGTAEVYQRGTVTPVTLYTDFEGTGTTANPTTLSSRGSAKIYVDQAVRVIVKNASGVTIEDYVDGKDANAVELRSASIVGNAYVGGAAAAGNPISVEAAFNKLITSFGTTDFKVLLGTPGVAYNLTAALGALWGQRVFDVTQYGAVGDGSTPCLNAFNSALSAANTAGGGVVYLPPGTYAISASLTTFSTVRIAGAGKWLSKVRMTGNADFIAGAGASFVKGITGIGFEYNAASFSRWLFIENGAGEVDISDCSFQNVNSGSTSVIYMRSAGVVRMARCSLGMSNPATGYALRVGDGVGSPARLEMTDCVVALTQSAAGDALIGTGSVLSAKGCRFDHSGNSGGQSSYGIMTESTGRAVVTGCSFVPAPAGLVTDYCFQNSGSGFVVESGNDLSASLALCLPSNVSRRLYFQGGSTGVDIRGTRESLSQNAESPNASPINIFLSQVGTVIIRTTGGSGTRVIDEYAANESCNGMRATLAVHNDTGSSITYQWGLRFASTGTTFAVAANSVRTFGLVYITERAEWYIVSDVAGAETAE